MDEAFSTLVREIRKYNKVSRGGIGKLRSTGNLTILFVRGSKGTIRRTTWSWRCTGQQQTEAVHRCRRTRSGRGLLQLRSVLKNPCMRSTRPPKSRPSATPSRQPCCVSSCFKLRHRSSPSSFRAHHDLQARSETRQSLKSLLPFGLPIKAA